MACLTAPAGKKPANSCGDCTAVSTYHDRDHQGQPTTIAVTYAPPARAGAGATTSGGSSTGSRR